MCEFCPAVAGPCCVCDRDPPDALVISPTGFNTKSRRRKGAAIEGAAPFVFAASANLCALVNVWKETDAWLDANISGVIADAMTEEEENFAGHPEKELWAALRDYMALLFTKQRGTRSFNFQDFYTYTRTTK